MSDILLTAPPDPESDTPLADAIARARELPANEGQIGAVVRPGDVGVRGAVKMTFGEAWSAGLTGQWMKQKGWEAAAFVGWRAGGR